MLLSGIYVLVLYLILLIDLQQQRIMNVVVFPATILALIASLMRGRETLSLALLGACAGFMFFSVLYWFGSKRYGRSALGFGDVKLAMLLGAMLGFQYVWPALVLGMLLAGLTSGLLLISGRARLRTTMPYGAFLAGAGIITLAWTTL